MKFVLGIILAALLLKPFTGSAQPQIGKPEKTTVCELIRDPQAWNRKLVEVTGLASHGFEDSGFSDPGCLSNGSWLWMEYGGKEATGTMSTVSDLSRSRPSGAFVDGIGVPLLEDDTFRRFDKLLHAGSASVVHATVIARVFAATSEPDGFRGYGHMGCCHLFMIEKVVKVDIDRPANLDYEGHTAHLLNAACEQGAYDPEAEKNQLSAQKDAESGKNAFAFNDPARVAREAVAVHAHGINADDVILKRRSSGAGYVLYDASPKGGKTRYAVTVSKPYWLYLIAQGSRKVAWVATSIASGCDD